MWNRDRTQDNQDRVSERPSAPTEILEYHIEQVRHALDHFDQLSASEKIALAELNSDLISGQNPQQYFQMADVMMIALDTDGRVNFINSKGCELLGCPPDEVLGKNWFSNFVPVEEMVGMRTIFNETISGKLDSTENRECPILCRDGNIRTISWQNSVLRDHLGNVKGLFASGKDRTERLATDEKKKQGRVLLVDDESLILLALEEILSDYDTTSAAHGAAAQKILAEDPNFDAVVCDLMMPNTSGMELHRWLVEANPDLARQMVFVTGGANSPLARQFCRESNVTILSKPLNVAELKEVVADRVQRSFHRDSIDES